MTTRRRRRGLRAFAWTLLFAASIYGLDRLILGPRPPPGWIAVESIDDVPRAVGPVLLPAYLPSTLEWPASHVLYRAGDDPGWWLGLTSRQRDDVVVWIGTGSAPLPDLFGDTRYCLDVATVSDCPTDWFSLSTSDRGRIVYVVSRLSRHTTREILTGLEVPPAE